MRYSVSLNQVYSGANSKAANYDLYRPTKKNLGLVIFIHGYKGFKDWGAWPRMAEYFAHYYFTFVKFNLSHNGTSLEDPSELNDLNAFAENRLSYEVEDCTNLYKEVVKSNPELAEIPLYLIGHSRGGGIAQVLAGEKLLPIKKLVLLNSISDFKSRFIWDIEKWKKEGKVFIENKRTGQKLPHNYTYYQDFLENQELFKLSVQRKKINCETTLIYGEKDEAVGKDEFFTIINEIKDMDAHEISNAGHTFNSAHPFQKKRLPTKFELMLVTVRDFLRL